MKRTGSHVRHFGHLPFRDVRVECFSFKKRCRVKKRKERDIGEKRRSEKILEQKKKKTWGNGRRERREVVVRRKKKN